MASDPNCSVCPDACSDLVTLPCGHIFCRLDRVPGESGGPTCPQCRDSLLQLTRDQARHEQSGSLQNDCHRSVAEACLPCDVHLGDQCRPEEQVLAKLASICPVHTKVLSHYCCEDDECICEACSLSKKHQTHHTKPVAEASEEKKWLGRGLLQQLTSEISEDEEQGRNLQSRRRTMEGKFVIIKEKVDNLFRDLRRQLQDLESRVLSEISRWEEQASLSMSDLLQQLDVKKDDLLRKMSHIEELCNATDPISVLEDWKSIKEEDLGWSEDGSGANDEPRSLSGTQEGLVLVTLHAGLSDMVTSIKKGFYIQQDPDVTLDEMTASNDIQVSGDLRTASSSEISQCRPRVPERFQYSQVLGTKSILSGRHYWELETGEGGNWRLGVAYSSIPRKGYHSLIGHSNKSWGLCRYFNQYMAIHDKRVTAVSHKPAGHRVGVYLDYEAGHLSFYELCHPIRHLCSFSVAFSEPLHLVLGVYAGWVKIRN